MKVELIIRGIVVAAMQLGQILGVYRVSSFHPKNDTI